jgi:hypothetical protein
VAEDYPFDETQIFDEPGAPSMRFVEHRFTGDPTNWSIPNAACTQAMLRSAGRRGSDIYVCRCAAHDPYGGPPPEHPGRRCAVGLTPWAPDHRAGGEPDAAAVRRHDASRCAGDIRRHGAGRDRHRPDDAASLQPVFAFRTDNADVHTEAPQVDGSRLIVMTPFPHRVLAFDLAQVPPALAWKYSPAANGMAAGLQCCGAPSGGMTVADGRVLLATQDGHVILLQATTASHSGTRPWSAPRRARRWRRRRW